MARWADRIGFILLMAAVGMLLFRPSDFLPALEGASIYEGLVIACLVVSLPRLWEHFRARALRENAITALVLLMVPAVMLSHLAHANTYDARLGGIEMAKACILFLLVSTQVSSLRRLRAALLAVMASACGMAVLALMQYHGAVDLPAMSAVEQAAESGTLVRLCGAGVFNDPNDFSLLLVIAGAVCAYGIGRREWGTVRWALLVPVAIFGYAFILTHSRGGFIAAGAAVLTFVVARFGWRNALPLMLVLAPIVLAPFWGRQNEVSFSDPEDTFQTRMELWWGSLDAFRSAPVLGIGQGKLVDSLGYVAHNSYLHAFAELGLLGGAAFIGSFYLVIRAIWAAAPADRAVVGLRPFVLAIVVSYAVGLLSLSRCYTVPTQLVLGLGAAYLVMASAPHAGVPRLDGACARRIGAVSVAMLAVTYVFVRLVLHGGPA